MGLLDKLVVIIGGDNKGAVSALDGTAASAERTALAQAKLAVSADKVAVAEAKLALAQAKSTGDTEAAAVATTTLATAQEKLAISSAEAGLAKASAGLANTERSLNEVGSSSNTATRALSQLGISGPVAIGAMFAVAAKLQASFVTAFAGATASVRSFQRVSGASAEDSSKLVAAFKVLGVDSDSAGTAIFRLAHNLDGSQQKLADLGVTVAKTREGNVDLANTFLNVADAVSKAGSGQKADDIAFAAFGRSAKDLLPVLLRGRDGLQELFDAAKEHHEIFSQADLEKGRQFTLATNEAKQAVEGLKIEAGDALIPFATTALHAAQFATELADKVGLVRAAITGLAGPVAGPLIQLAGWLGIGKSKTEDLAAAAVKAADAANQQADAEQQDADAISKADSAMEGLISASDTYRGSIDAVTTAEQAVADAHAEVATKTADLAKANHDATQANMDLATAQGKLNEAERQAPLQLEQDRTNATLATHSLAKAEEALVLAKLKYGSINVKTKDAEDAVTKSRQDAADAADKLGQAEKAGDRPDSVVQAENNVAAAKERQATAAAAITKAQKEDPAGDLAKAEQKLTDAKDAQLLDQHKLDTALSNYNTLNGTNLGIQDAINGKLDETIAKQLTILNNQAAAAAAEADADKKRLATDAANRAAVVTFAGGGAFPGPPPLTPAQQAAADQAKTAATAAAKGRGDPSNPLVQRNTNPAQQITINVKTTGDGKAIGRAVGDELTFLGRVG